MMENASTHQKCFGLQSKYTLNTGLSIQLASFYSQGSVSNLECKVFNATSTDTHTSGTERPQLRTIVRIILVSTLAQELLTQSRAIPVNRAPISLDIRRPQSCLKLLASHLGKYESLNVFRNMASETQ